ncbi:MAG: DUF2993 domain-containing protein [Leucobacter sp.]|jgi:hypothetical protein|nr:DUF2993 domain-containing protein [Leucobacter sp.]
MNNVETTKLTDVLGAPSEFEAQPRRRAWVRRVIWAIVVLALLVGCAELALRVIIPNIVASQIRDQFGLPASHPVDVELLGSALLPALSGRVGPIEVEVPDALVFDGIETTLRASADSVPFNTANGDILGAEASVTVPSSSMGAVVSLVTNGMADSGEILGGELIVGRSIELFGVEATVTASIKASVSGGDLLIEPTGVNAAGFNLSAEELRPLLGEAAAAVLDVHTVCVRDRLPKGLTLTDLTFVPSLRGGEVATATARLAPDILSNPDKLQPGTCADDQ